MAQKKLFNNFIRKHPKLAFRTPQLISLARVKSFTKKKKQTLSLTCFNQNRRKWNLIWRKVYTVDETGISIAQDTRTNVLSVKGKKQVARLSSAERGPLMTAVTCMSASGTFVPPLIVLPKATLKPELLNGTILEQLPHAIQQDGYKHTSSLRDSSTLLRWSSQSQTTTCHTRETQRSLHGDDTIPASCNH
jgi:hypothetical protein